MKARITFDFAELFCKEENKQEDGFGPILIANDYALEHMKKGDIVEIVRTIESDSFPNGKGYVIYNPNNHISATVSVHALDFFTSYAETETIEEYLIRNFKHTLQSVFPITTDDGALTLHELKTIYQPETRTFIQTLQIQDHHNQLEYTKEVPVYTLTLSSLNFYKTTFSNTHADSYFRTVSSLLKTMKENIRNKIIK